jgi:hypothetical protein
VAIALGAGIGARAQERVVRAEKVTPIRLQIVLSRVQGEKRVSSMPYTLSINVPAIGPGVANLRMGAKIPIVMMAAPAVPGPDGKLVPTGPIQYQDVGTNIDARVVAMDDGRFGVDVTVDDTSVYPDEAGKMNDRPSFRSFRASNSLILKDGAAGQFTSATDKVNGEVTKVDVTLTVVK